MLYEADSLTLITSRASIWSRRGERRTIFSLGINPHEVMSNHIHVVVPEPESAADWKDEGVANRWMRLYPFRDKERNEARKATLTASIDTYRKRLCDLSWF